MRTIAIMNNKGGVGKTVTAINLADILVNEYHKRVVLVDCDGQKNLTDFYALPGYDEDTCYNTVSLLLGDGEPLWSDNLTPISLRLDIIPASTDLYGLDMENHRDGGHEPRRIRDFVEAARADGEVDFFIFDCPPGFTVASVGALLASDEVIVPLTVDGFALNGLDAILRNLRTIRQTGAHQPKVLITRHNRTRAVKYGEQMLRGTGIPVFETVIPQNASIAASTLTRPGQPLSEYAPHSKGYAAYRALAAELLGGDASGL